MSSAATEKKQRQRKPKEEIQKEECQICYETLNKSSNKPIVCPYSSCAYTACISCVKTYLLGNPQSAAHCMACKKSFNNLFLVQNLTKIWTNDTYIPHVSTVLTEMELARVPEAMEEAERLKKVNALKSKLKELCDTRSKFLEPIKNLKDQQYITISQIRYRGAINIHDFNRIKRQTKENISEIETDEYKKELLRVRTDILDIQNQIAGLKSSEQKEERKVFTMPCSHNECKGMLSTQYKCGLCENYTCKDCHEPLQEEHKCNPDTVATKQSILKDTRPCPSCNTRIFKIEGCDQMWCTSCKTPFSWTSGKIVPSGQRLHNPHAIEYMRQSGITVRAPGDLVCGGVITQIQMKKLIHNMSGIMNECIFIYGTYENCIQALKEHEVYKPQYGELNVSFNNITWFFCVQLMYSYGIVDVVSRNKLRESREVAQSHRNFNNERVKYILDEMDKDAFTRAIQKYNKQKNSQTEMSHIWELVSNFGIDMFNVLYNASKNYKTPVYFYKLVVQKLSELSALIKYANSQFATVSVAHSIAVETIRYQNEFSFASKDEFEQWVRANENMTINNYRLHVFKTEKFSQVALKKMM